MHSNSRSTFPLASPAKISLTTIALKREPAMTVDHRLVAELTSLVQDALVTEATSRVQTSRGRLDRRGQEVLAESILREHLQRIDAERLTSGQVRLDPVSEQRLVDRVLALSVGLGPVEVLLGDPMVEEIVATRFDLVFLYRSDGSVEQVDDKTWSTEAEMSAWISHVARTAGRTERQFNAQSPLLVMRLGDGMRLAATRDVSKFVSFALRRNTLGKVTLADLVGLEMMPPVVADLLRACMAATEVRLVFSGPTGSGKTTLIRACLGELDPMARVVIIEDTAELDLFDPVLHPNVESWEARLANNEGEGAIGQGAQVKHALRYRPDWLVCGEVRDSDAAVPMLKAMTHGQSSLTTVHSASAVGALDSSRCTSAPAKTSSRLRWLIINCTRLSISWFTSIGVSTADGVSSRSSRWLGSTGGGARPTRCSRRTTTDDRSPSAGLSNATYGSSHARDSTTPHSTGCRDDHLGWGSPRDARRGRSTRRSTGVAGRARAAACTASRAGYR